jgi:uncharacterized protein YndB with AHSA1/START domain
VFAAWLDPASLALWMCPGDVQHAEAEVDARVGGQFRILMRHGRDGYEHRGEYLVIDRPSRLSFTWISTATEFRPTVVTVELHEQGDATELVLTHQGLAAASASDHRKGWSDIVRKLGDVLSAGR